MTALVQMQLVEIDWVLGMFKSYQRKHENIKRMYQKKIDEAW